jgi:two-component system KDP operon response regulator KdpE
MDDPLVHRKLLVIDDDLSLLNLLNDLFTRAGATVIPARDAHEGLRQFYAQQPDLVILDILMPGIDGWEVCKSLRRLSDVPILMLTALGNTEQITRGLEKGADDYVTKPFANQVLLARVRALLRRSTRAFEGEPLLIYADGHLTVDLEKRQVLVDQQPIRLSPTEYKLLAYLVQNAGRVLSHEQILTHVWGAECLGYTEYIHMYINRLRRKLEEDWTDPHYLVTEPRVGYRFEHRHLPES